MTEVRRSERLAGRLPRPAVAPGPPEEYRYLFGERPLLEGIPEIYQRRANRFLRSTLPERRIPAYERREFCDCLYDPSGTCGPECRNRLERYECDSSNCVHPMCSNRRIQYGDFPPVRVEFHPSKGRTLCLGDTVVAAGTILGCYVGEVIGEGERQKRESLFGWTSIAYTLNYDRGICIDANREGGLMRFASHRCGRASMVVHHWYVGDQRHVVFEANDDLEAGAELHFNYFLHERNLAAKEKQFRSWGGCACGAAECEGSIINDTALWMNEVGVEDGSPSRDFILAGSPGVDVLEQLGHHPGESVCVRDISGDVLLVDEGAPARGLMQWGTAGFLCGDFLDILSREISRRTLAGHSILPATVACPFWISDALVELNMALYEEDQNLERLAQSGRFQGLVASAAGTQAILVLNAGNCHYLTCQVDFEATVVSVYDSFPSCTSHVLLSRVTRLMEFIRRARYADGAMRDWQCTHMNVETQACGENNCAVFAVWHVLAIIWSLNLCTNLLARRLRKVWFPFLIWAIGGSELRLRPVGGGEPSAPVVQ